MGILLYFIDKFKVNCNRIETNSNILKIKPVITVINVRNYLLPNLFSRLAVSKHVHIHRLTVDKYYLGGILFGRFF